MATIRHEKCDRCQAEFPWPDGGPKRLRAFEVEIGMGYPGAYTRKAELCPPCKDKVVATISQLLKG